VAGIVEPGESPEDVARRESIEESGIELGELIPITGYLPSPGGCDEWIELFCALVDAPESGGVFGLDEEGEDIKVHVIPAIEAFALVQQRVVNNAAAIIALQWLQLNHDRLKRSGVDHEA
jgi:ADP-ribose pyrophosphatase